MYTYIYIHTCCFIRHHSINSGVPTANIHISKYRHALADHSTRPITAHLKLGQHLAKTRCSVNIPLQLSSLHNVQNPCSQLTCFLKSTIVAKQSPFLEGLKLFLKYFDKTTHQRMLLAPGIDQLLDKQVKSKAYSTHTYIYNVYVKHIVT